MAMEKGLDTGPILKQSEIKIGLFHWENMLKKF